MLLIALTNLQSITAEDSMAGRVQDASTNTSLNPQTIIKPILMQLSDNDSGDSNLDDETMILTVFLLNVIGCALGCLFIQVVITISKKLTLELAVLRKNYEQFKSLKKFKELRESSLNI